VVVIAAAAGTGTPGANQNGPATAPGYSPGEVVTAAGPLTVNAPAPQVDIAVGTNIVTKAYDLAAWKALRPGLVFDQFAQVRSTNQSHRGSSVQFTFVKDVPEQVTPLLENIDVDSVSMDSSTVVVSMLEYGTAVTTTALLRGTGFIPFDPIAAERVGWNAGLSLDTLARTALTAATQSVGGGNTDLDAYTLREAVHKLQSANVRPMADGNYAAIITPTQAQQLKSDASSNNIGWRNVVSDTPGNGNSIYTGEIGVFENCRIVVNNHAASAGAGFVLGAEGLAKAYSSAPGFGAYPTVVVSPVVDKLRRFASVGWYWLGGYKVFRDEAVVKLSTNAVIKARA
jgi:N4-gp56 family major capsid protein